ncbi:MAG TPA: hypothetical protein VK666_27415 [Chryseolinea sp.]|nr:hypothetical protein [Chryseolinea sp.]
MNRLVPLLLVILFGSSCSKHESPVAGFVIHEQALAMAASRCQNAQKLDWLVDIIERAEQDVQFKGSIYAIAVNTETVFLHQPWINNCFGCNLYNCNGDALTLSEGDRTMVLAGVSDENLIFTSFQ